MVFIKVNFVRTKVVACKAYSVNRVYTIGNQGGCCPMPGGRR